MRIYLASSWRNPLQPHYVELLRAAGHEVYDFRHPVPGNEGFAWRDLDPRWTEWDSEEFRDALESPIAISGFGHDIGALRWCDCCVLLLPSGRSAHLEAGWAAGAGKLVYIVLEGENEPELMYMMATHLCLDENELLDVMAKAS